MDRPELNNTHGPISWSEFFGWFEWLALWSVVLYLAIRLNGSQFWWLLIWAALFACSVVRRAEALRAMARTFSQMLGATLRANSPTARSR